MKIFVIADNPAAGRVERWVADWLEENPGATFGGRISGESGTATASSAGTVPQEGDRLVFADPDPARRRARAKDFHASPAEPFTFVHPAAVTGERVSLATGVVIGPGATITCDVEVGAFTLVDPQATIGHDNRIGPFCTIGRGADVARLCRLGEGVRLGARARLIPERRLGPGAVVEDAAVVVRHVKAGERVAGNPARRVRSPNSGSPRW
mgnify:CR=1 FL=1